MRGKIERIHTCRDSREPPATLAQVWVVTTDDNAQYLLTVKPRQMINFTAKGNQITKIDLKPLERPKGVNNGTVKVKRKKK